MNEEHLFFVQKTDTDISRIQFYFSFFFIDLSEQGEDLVFPCVCCATLMQNNR